MFVFWLSACTEPTKLPPPPGTAEVLEALPGEVILPRVERLEEQVDLLAETTGTWAATGLDADRDLARVAWTETRQTWAELESMQLGPVATHAVWIHSFPDVERCAVDRDALAGTVGEEPAHVGLDALEQLLFATGTACEETDPAWEALDRATHAHRLSEGLGARVQTLRMELDDFSLSAATYGSQEAALAELFAALDHLGTGIRDLRVAEPMGEGTCVVDCEQLVESRGLSDASHVWLQHQVVGLGALFEGEEEPGVPELLAGVGQQELAPRFLERLSVVMEDVDRLEGSVDTTLVATPGRMQRLLDSLDEAVDVLDREIRPALGLPRTR